MALHKDFPQSPSAILDPANSLADPIRLGQAQDA